MNGRRGILRHLVGMALLSWALGCLTAAPPAGKPVAVVNGVNIYQADLEAVTRPAGQQTAVEPSAASKRAMQMQALMLLIDDILMQQFLAVNAPAVPPAEVNQKIAELTASLTKQGKTLAQFCQESRTTEEAIRKELTARLQWAAYSRTRVSDAEVQKYYAENKDIFDGTTVRASHIVIRMAPNASEAEKSQARARLTSIREQLLAGKMTFVDAAKAHSQCPSAQNGGDLGFFPRVGVVDDNFARVAFALQVGQISDVVASEFGLHLIYVSDRKNGQPPDLNAIKEQVREGCAQQIWQSVLEQQRKTAKVELNMQQ